MCHKSWQRNLPPPPHPTPTPHLPRPRPGPTQGGTRAAPRQFNDRNREEPDNYWPSAANCSYVVTLRDPGSGTTIDELGELAGGRHSPHRSWPAGEHMPGVLHVPAACALGLQHAPCLEAGPSCRRPSGLGGGGGPALFGCGALASPDARLLHPGSVARQEPAHGLCAAAAEGGAVTRLRYPAPS